MWKKDLLLDTTSKIIRTKSLQMHAKEVRNLTKRILERDSELACH